MAASTVVFFGGVELLLHVVGWPPPPQVGVAGGDAWARDGAEAFMMPDPELLWRFRPGTRIDARRPGLPRFTQTVNHQGFRGEPMDGLASGPLIACAGDSVTAGYGVDDHETYPARLEAILRHLPGREECRVLNAGVYGYSTEQGRIVVRALLARWRPAVVIVSFGQNDDSPAAWSDADLIAGRSEVRAVQRGFARSRLYRAMRELLMRPSRTAADRAVRVPAERYVDNLRSIVADVRAVGAEVVLVAPPSITERLVAAPYVRFHAPLSVYRALMAAVAHDEHVPFVDDPRLSGRSPDSPRLFVDVRHPGAEGMCVLAEDLAPVVASALDRALRVGPPPPRKPGP